MTLTEAQRDGLFQVASVDFHTSGPEWVAVIEVVEAIVANALVQEQRTANLIAACAVLPGSSEALRQQIATRLELP